MKAYFVCTDGGPMVALTSCDSIDHPDFLEMVRAKGYRKFIAHEVPLETVKARYGVHFEAVCQNPFESDTLRVLDYEGKRVYRNFSFEEFGPPQYYELSADGNECLWSYQPEAKLKYFLGESNLRQSREALPVG